MGRRRRAPLRPPGRRRRAQGGHRAVHRDRRGDDRGSLDRSPAARVRADRRGAARGAHAHRAAGRTEGVRAGRRRVRSLARAGSERTAAGRLDRRGCRQRTVQSEGRDDLGAVDSRAARIVAGLRGRSHVPGVVPPPVHRARRTRHRAVAGPGRPRAAQRRRAGVERPRHRGDAARARAGDVARPAAARAGRGHRRHPVRAVRRQRCQAPPDQPAAGRRRPAWAGTRKDTQRPHRP